MSTLTATDEDLPFDDVLNPVKKEKWKAAPDFDENDLFGDSTAFEVDDPFSDPDAPWERYTKKQRMTILLITTIPMILQPFSTTMVVPSFNDIMDDLLVPYYVLIVLTVAGYNIMGGIFPMIYGPVSDRFGRKFLWYFTLPAFAVAATLSGFSFDIWMLIICRSILGAFACSVVIVGTGIVTDIFPPENQGKALGLQQIPALLSPMLGYPLGGALTSFFGWRSVNFFLAIGSIPITLFVFMLLPETLPKDPSRKVSVVAVVKAMNPLNTLKFLFRPIIGLISIARAVGYSCMMLFVLLNPGILGAVHHDSAFEIGLWNLPFSVGTIVGSILGGVAVDRALKKFGRGGRLISANFSTFIISVGLIGYGWTIEWNQWVGMLFSVLIGFGVAANRPGYLSYAMQENPSNAAAVTGATMFFSMLLTLILSIVGPPCARILGIPALFTFLSCLTLGCTIPTIIIMGLNMSNQPDMI